MQLEGAVVEGPHRLAVDLRGGHGHQLALGVAQGGEAAAEHAAGIEVDGVVEPFGIGHGRVAKGNHGPAPVLAGPFVAHGQAEFVHFAGAFAKQREGPYSPRQAPDDTISVGWNKRRANVNLPAPVLPSRMIRESSGTLRVS